MSQIRVHVSRPEDPAVPNTGMLTQSTPTITDGTGTVFYFGLGIIIAIIMVAILPAFLYRKWKKQGFSKKQLIPRILLVAIFSFGLSFGALYFAKTSTVNTLGATTGEELTATAGDVDIYVELEDEPVFASVSSTIKVDKATEVGYILKGYAASADLVLNTDSTKKIPEIASSDPSSMTENTWGISLTETNSQEAATWQALPTAQANAITIKDTTAQTAANDQTTIYYGVYVSPDTEPGTYIGTVSYIATPYLIMQEVNEWGDSIEVNQERVAVDKRDGRKYTVARLKDGNLWMTQNLDLGRTNLAVDLTSENTNLETTVTADVFNSWRHDAGINSFEEGDVVIDDSIDSLSGKPHGMKYNYFAVSAGTISGPVNTGDAQYDICPAGWRLPTGGASGEFQALYAIEDYNSNEKMRAPVSEGGAAFTLSNENFGAYWSSTMVSDTGTSADSWNIWSLRIDQTNVRPTHNHQRKYNISIRCVAREDYSIVYDGNAGSNNDTTNTVVGDMSSLRHDNVANGSEVQLYASNFSRSNYGFAGWSLDPEAGAKINSANAPTIYGPNEIVTISEELFPRNHNITLYAVWVPKSEEYTMQSFDPSQFSGADTGYVLALQDVRNNRTYAVAKLADGNFWMIENLNLNLSDSDITRANTNNPSSDFLAALAGGTEMTTSWCNEATDECYNTVKWFTGDNPSYGTYYNSYTANAGNATMEMGDGNSSSGDLCPIDWHMPKGSEAGEYAALDVELGGTGTFQNADAGLAQAKKWSSFPNNFVKAGYVDGPTESLIRTGTHGLLHSATMRSGGQMYYYSFSTTVNPGYYGTTGRDGYTIRCIADNTFSIDYDGNSGSNNDTTNSVVGDMSTFRHSDIEDGTSIALNASRYSRINYGFAGWSTDPEAGLKVNDDNRPAIYGPNETIVVSSDTFPDSRRIKLYAVWVPKSQTYTMQSFDPDAFASEDIGHVIALEDVRDNITYAVAKLADGNYWMTENIRTNIQTADINTSNTNNPTSAFLLERQTNASAESDSWCTEASEECIDQVKWYSDEQSSGMGNLYNWYTVTAGNGSYSVSDENAAGDICPSGWHIPTGFSEGENKALATALGIDTVNGYNNGTEIPKLYLKYPYNYTYAGNINSQLVNNRGSVGYYWTSTPLDNVATNRFYLRNDQVRYATGSVNKYCGLSIRCLVNQ